jgi:hypothetical protein
MRPDHDALVAEMRAAGLVPRYFRCATCTFLTVHWAPPDVDLLPPPCNCGVRMERVGEFDVAPHAVGLDVEAP